MNTKKKSLPSIHANSKSKSKSKNSYQEKQPKQKKVQSQTKKKYKYQIPKEEVKVYDESILEIEESKCVTDGKETSGKVSDAKEQNFLNEDSGYEPLFEQSYIVNK